VLKNLCIGLDYTMNELMNAYQQFGIKPIDALGKKFDANYHQAMFELEDASVPAGTVVQEVQKGYMIHDRLLRPAMVGVSKGGQPQNVDKAI
jgi:molecular chaperone GrpE